MPLISSFELKHLFALLQMTCQEDYERARKVAFSWRAALSLFR